MLRNIEDEKIDCWESGMYYPYGVVVAVLAMERTLLRTIP